MKRKIITILLCVIFLGIIIFSLFKIFTNLYENKKSNDAYENLNEYIDKDSEIIYPKVDFKELKKINQEVIGWISIPDLDINYPIVQTDDNDYYLNHLIDGSKNKNGSIFLDYRNQKELNDQNSIIYGHYTRNKTMFTNLKAYKKQTYYDEHPYYVIVTPTENYKIDIFAGYVASVEEDAWKINFKNDQEFLSWLEKTKEKSLFKSDIEPTSKDKVITLSTCSYEFENARFVLVGVISKIK